jgi:hypothetical protein
MNTLIRKFILSEEHVTVVSGKIRFSSSESLVMPSGTSAIARTQLVSVGRLVEWLGMKIYETGTALAYRLYDGTSYWYWTGATWALATQEAHWNTELEISTGFPNYPNKKLALAIKFSAVDSILQSVMIGFKIDSAIEEDFLLSLISHLKQVTYELDYLYGTKSSISSIDLGAETLLKDYNITNVLKVYNHTADPDHLQPLSFTFAAGKITLGTPIQANKEIWSVLEVKPVVAYYTSPDYSELEKYPAIIIESVAPVRSVSGAVDLFIPTGPDYEAIVLEELVRDDYRITLVPVAEKLIEHLRMVGNLRKFVREHSSFSLRDSGLEVDMMESAPYTSRGVGQDGLLSGSIEVDVFGVEHGFKESDGYIIGRVLTTLNRR